MSSVTIYSLDVFLSLFRARLLFHGLVLNSKLYLKTLKDKRKLNLLIIFTISRTLIFLCECTDSWASQVTLVVRNPPANARGYERNGLISGSEKSPTGGHSNPLQYSCLETPVDRWAWPQTVHRFAQSGTERVHEHAHMLALVHPWYHFPRAQMTSFNTENCTNLLVMNFFSFLCLPQLFYLCFEKWSFVIVVIMIQGQ